MKQRDASVELYRALLMFGICLLHSMTFLESHHRGLDNVLLSCVDGFVFISGWYGIRFKWRKVLNLIGISVWCAFVALSLDWLLFKTAPSVQGYFVIFKGYWFLWAYIVVMFLSPLLNVQWRQGIGLLFCVFVWSYCCHIPGLKDYLPKAGGFGAYTLFTMMGVYVCGRLCRAAQVDLKLSTNRCIVLWCVLFMLAWIGLGHYNSPVAMGLAIVSFCLFKRLKVSNKLAPMVFYIGPSLFAVFCLHGNGFGLRVARRINEFAGGGYAAYFLTATVLFFGAMVVDAPRRLAVWFGNKCASWAVSQMK